MPNDLPRVSPLFISCGGRMEVTLGGGRCVLGMRNCSPGGGARIGGGRLKSIGGGPGGGGRPRPKPGGGGGGRAGERASRSCSSSSTVRTLAVTGSGSRAAGGGARGRPSDMMAGSSKAVAGRVGVVDQMEVADGEPLMSDSSREEMGGERGRPN